MTVVEWAMTLNQGYKNQGKLSVSDYFSLEYLLVESDYGEYYQHSFDI